MKINFESSTACNARCVFCPRYQMTRPMGEMTDELFHKIIKDGKAMGVRHYSPFMNGEPFVFPRIWEWLDYMQKERVVVSLYTNGEFLDVERLCVYKNIRYVTCSVNAANEETYNKVMRGPNYERVVKNVKSLFEKAYFMVRASFVICEENYHEAEAFKKMYPKVKIVGYYNWTGDKHSYLQRTGDREPCWVLFNQMAVLWDGRVVPCCSDYNAKLVLGNANTETLGDIWKRAEDLRKQHRDLKFDNPACKTCDYNCINLYHE